MVYKDSATGCHYAAGFFSLQLLLFLFDVPTVLAASGQETLAVVATTDNNSYSNDSLQQDLQEDEPFHSSVHLASWNFDFVEGPLIYSLFILLAGIVKIGFHHVKFISFIFPESCILIAIGTGVGAIIHFALEDDEYFTMDYRTFMLFLLPPIVLEAAYSLNNRAFADNLGTILLYAVVGTVINFVIIGFSLWGLKHGGVLGLEGIPVLLVHCLLFASFIVAVDPVAVLAIFQDIHINATLYFLVFGESLLNDAVTVVLSNVMKAFSDSTTNSTSIQAEEIVIGIFSFFTISIGGLCIGVLIGFGTTLITRLTSEVRVVEPLAMLITAYLAYLCAELVHWSGIISMIGCGIVQAQYAFHNISKKSSITVTYFIKMLSSTCESIIFLFLGLELVRTPHKWDTYFVLWTLLLCLVARIVSVFGLTFFVNLRNRRVKPIKAREQFIMWYGGLRGAICFALCNSITTEISAELKQVFMTTTFVIILFTVFIQGVTIKPLVKYCHISRQKEESSEPLFISIQDQVLDGTLTLVEIMIGQRGQNFVRAWVHNINDKYLKRWLQHKPETQTDKLLKLYKQAAVEYFETVILDDGNNQVNREAEEEFLLEIREELQRHSSVTSPEFKAGVYNDPNKLKRILSRSTLWLHDRDLVHEADRLDDQEEAKELIVSEVVHRYRTNSGCSQDIGSSHRRIAVTPRHSEDDTVSNGKNLQHAISIPSLTDARRRMILPTFGTRRQPASNVRQRITRRHSDQSKPPSTTSLPPELGLHASSRHSGGRIVGRYVPRKCSATQETLAPSIGQLSALGEEDASDLTRSEQQLSANHANYGSMTASGGGYVNPIMVQPNGAVGGKHLDVDTFGEYVEPSTWM